MGAAAVLIAVVMFSSFGNVFEGNENMAATNPVKPDAIAAIMEEVKKKKEENEQKEETTAKEGFTSFLDKERQFEKNSNHISTNSRSSGGSVLPFSFTDNTLPSSNF